MSNVRTNKKDERVYLRLENEMRETFIAEAEKRGLSLSAFIRMVVLEYIESHKK